MESCSTILALHKLPQQLALRTPQRRIPNDPKSQNIGVTVMMHRTVNDPSRSAGPDPGRANRSPERSITTHRTRRSTRVMMQIPKLRHEQRSEVPELLQTLPWAVSSTWSALQFSGWCPGCFFAWAPAPDVPPKGAGTLVGLALLSWLKGYLS